MPFGKNVMCHKCKTSDSLMWHSDQSGIQCNDCHEIESSRNREPAPPSVEKPKTPKKSAKTPRSRATRQNPNAIPKQFSSKGKGKRHIFKKTQPIKLTSKCATIVTSEKVMFKGQLYRVGDIVSVIDVEGGTYYAQISGLMTDEYCEKGATLRWLLPTLPKSAFIEGFDPMTYVLGPEEDLARNLDCMKFLMHAPSDYFKTNSPFPTGKPNLLRKGLIWGRMQHSLS